MTHREKEVALNVLLELYALAQGYRLHEAIEVVREHLQLARAHA